MKRNFKKSVIIIATVVMVFATTLSAYAANTVNLNSAIDDISNWVKNDTIEMSSKDGKLHVQGNDGITSYLKSGSYMDKLMEFTLTFDAISPDGNVLVLNTRHGNQTQFFWTGESKNSYCVWIRKDSIEVQKWLDGAQVMLRNDVVSPFTETGKAYKVQFGAVPVSGGTKVILIVDGKTIVDEMDSETPVPVENSYLTLYAFDPVSFGKVSGSGSAAVNTGGTAAASNPRTGDDGILIIYVVLAVISIAGIVIISKKRRSLNGKNQ